MTKTSVPRDTWPKAMATVISCTYEFGAGRALAFGAPMEKHFRIAFNYWANGEIHAGEFSSARAVQQGTLFPVSYNPEAPQEHDHNESSPARGLLVVVGVFGSLLLAWLWFFLFRGRS